MFYSLIGLCLSFSPCEHTVWTAGVNLTAADCESSRRNVNNPSQSWFCVAQPGKVATYTLGDTSHAAN